MSSIASSITNPITSRSAAVANFSDSELPEGTTARLLVGRLKAWTHAVSALEEYCDSMAKMQKAGSEKMAKIAQAVGADLKEPDQFDAGENGVTGLFRTLHETTVNYSNIHVEAERQLRTVIVPILTNLHNDLKAQTKEVTDTCIKTYRRVEKSRNETQKVLEDLSASASHCDSSNEKTGVAHDPMVLNRHIMHRFNKQILEENGQLTELKALQERLRMHEGHIVETMQDALERLNEAMALQADGVKGIFSTIHATAASIGPDFEWEAFNQRNSQSLLALDTPPRQLADVTYPEQNHHLVNAVVSGHLQRKSRVMLKGWEDGFWAISPIGYLHGFKDADPINHEWEPHMSLYLPECFMPKVDGAKFDIKGKNHAGTVSAAVMSFDLHFRAITPVEAQKWISAINGFISGGTTQAGQGKPMALPIRPGSMTGGPTPPLSPAGQSPGGQSFTTCSSVPAASEPVSAPASAPAPAPASPATATPPTPTSSAALEAQQAREDAAFHAAPAASS
ncbi:hypothetical protein KEM52_001070 [Ascosphaera acerosa]|nr:hypothetical protein KEM52_001070 [Ascosphaera acerosa]